MADATAGTYGADDRRRRMPVAWFLGALAALGVVGLTTLSTTRAAFSSSTGNSGSSFSAGTVNLTDDDGGNVFFNLSSMVPNTTDTKCVKVSYSGVQANVRLYGAVSNSPTGAGSLAPYLTTKIEEGTGTASTGGAAMSCTGFASTSTVHGTAAGATTLADFAGAHSNFGNGIGLFGGPTATSARYYRITVTLQDDNNAQGKDAQATFTWEAQNT